MNETGSGLFQKSSCGIRAVETLCSAATQLPAFTCQGHLIVPLTVTGKLPYRGPEGRGLNFDLCPTAY